MVSRRAISDAIAAFMVDSPIECLFLPSSLSPLALIITHKFRRRLRCEEPFGALGIGAGP